ncbi:MAG: ABC transporter ATP-binding protein [Alistipes timonensis]|nr:ABC transporter ATP-binding protein [Alistipes timonensis]
MISLRGISKSYGNLKVLDSVDLDIDRAEIVSVVGPSGAGKTTLLQILGTLDRPDSGTVCYDGEMVLGLPDSRLARFRNRNIGFVFQFHQLLPEFTTLENAALPALIGGESRAEAFARAEQLLRDLGLGARLTHRPAQLSGGERQRAAVARALVNNPSVILADEPSGSLDSRNRRELHDLFIDLRAKTGTTFVIVTHDETLADRSDRVIHMADGRITSPSLIL